MNRRTVVIIACVAAAIAALPAVHFVEEKVAEAAFRHDMVALSHVAKDKAAALGSYEERDQFFVWYLDEMRGVVDRHEDKAPPRLRATLHALGQLFEDTRVLVSAANTERQNARDLDSIEPYRYADDAVYQAAVAKIDANIQYLSSRAEQVAAKRDEQRRRLAHLDLDEDQRAQLWQPLAAFYEGIAADTRSDAHKADSFRVLRRLADFMHANKDQYVVGDDDKLLFRRPDLLMQFRSLAFELQTGLSANPLQESAGH